MTVNSLLINIWKKAFIPRDVRIKEFKEALNMSKIEIKPFEEQIRIAGISGELERAEEKGYRNGLKEGLKEGPEKIISNMLKKYTPEEVSKITDIPLKRILKIKDDGGF